MVIYVHPEINYVHQNPEWFTARIVTDACDHVLQFVPVEAELGAHVPPHAGAAGHDGNEAQAVG